MVVVKAMDFIHTFAKVKQLKTNKMEIELMIIIFLLFVIIIILLILCRMYDRELMNMTDTLLSQEDVIKAYESKL